MRLLRRIHRELSMLRLILREWRKTSPERARLWKAMLGCVLVTAFVFATSPWDATGWWYHASYVLAGVSTALTLLLALLLWSMRASR